MGVETASMDLCVCALRVGRARTVQKIHVPTTAVSMECVWMECVTVVQAGLAMTVPLIPAPSTATDTECA